MPDQLAAVDLGSNSFHMIVARLEDDRLKIIDRLRDRVQLAAGFDKRGNITAEAEARALECLEQFGQRVRELKVGRVRAVGTNALRKAKNGRAFLKKAGKVLGHPIEIIAGREEARLIYLGVIQTLSLDTKRKFVVDIGGGSTECIVGDGAEIFEADSLFMGCVSYSKRFFVDGYITEENFEQAEVAARAELRPLVAIYRSRGWDAAIGCSGTIHAVQKILKANRWSQGTITKKSVKLLKRSLIECGHVDELDIPGLLENRKSVIAGGVAILRAVFSVMKIEEMTPSPGALREGVLFDLVGRLQHEDVREKTVEWYCDRYQVDITHAKQVHRVAEGIYEQVRNNWQFEEPAARKLLRWACYLHEIGSSISHTGFHKHSAYLVENADMAGFSRNAQRVLSAIIRNHRRKFHPEAVDDLPERYGSMAKHLSIILRLATTLQRSRGDQAPRAIEVKTTSQGMILYFSADWLERHPMTFVDINKDIEYLRAADFVLEIVEEQPK
ncbi:MAG: exopolyphosphatase [Myxococcota bacterium]|nr:exopolyphosphatase [Myxococcota bacterium]